MNPNAKNALSNPWIVPSFSSRAFPRDRHRLKSHTQNHFRAFANYFDVFLISAFDIYYGYINTKDIPKDKIVLIDSGGYEKREWDDDSAIYLKLRPLIFERLWTKWHLAKVIRKLPDEERFIFINLDSEGDPAAQISKAQHQFKNLKNAQRSFLMKKPNSATSSLYICELAIQDPSYITKQLSNFNVIGITEKELGDSYYERIKTIKTIRLLLDSFNILTPIHIFGSLDPISVKIYTIAGASIFDGLTWLRFAYKEGKCVYIGNDILLESALESLIEEEVFAIYNRNYIELNTLQDSLKEYRSTGSKEILQLPKPILNKVEAAIEKIESSTDYKKLSTHIKEFILTKR